MPDQHNGDQQPANPAQDVPPIPSERRPPYSPDRTNGPDKKPQNPDTPWFKAYVVFTGCLVVVGVTYSYFAYLQWQATSAALVTGERAWVTSGSVTFSDFSKAGDTPLLILNAP